MDLFLNTAVLFYDLTYIAWEVSRVAECLGLPTLEYQILGLNPAEGRIQDMILRHYCTEPSIITLPLSWYDL